MNLELRTFGDDRIQNNAFLDLADKLYGTRDKQSRDEVEQILRGTHPLSHYFVTHNYLVYRDAEPVARAILFIYPDDDRAYVGYYECIDDDRVAEVLFEAVSSDAKAAGKTSLYGPYNANFWVSYRLKTNQFDRPTYMGEPYNQAYYPAQFIANGFSQSQRYISNEYGFKVNINELKQFSKTRTRAHDGRYHIRSPHPSEFSATMVAVHRLITTLYSDFPGYKAITADEFVACYSSFAHILDYSFVKLASYEDELVGFVIAFPDYGSLLYQPMTRLNRLRIAWRKVRAPRYVVMYLGVLPEHTGLGKALLRPLITASLVRGARLIGALALENKVTASYGKSMIRRQYRYGMFEKHL